MSAQGRYGKADHMHVGNQMRCGYCLFCCTGLPKTRSGKIMRRVLRKIAAKQEDELGDVSTLADPSVVEALIGNRP